MPIVRLTDGPKGSIRRKPPAEGMIELYDDLLKGFGLRVQKRASTYFVVTRVRGRAGQIRRRLGTTTEIGLADAREAARRVLQDAQAGLDPRRTPSEPPPSPAPSSGVAGTFKAVADKYLADKLDGGGAGLRSRDELLRKLKVDLAAWHERPIGEITKAEIRELVRGKAQQSPAAANRLLSFIKRVFGWAAAQDYIDADPAAAIPKPGKEQERSRFLSEEEIRIVWKACDRLGDPFGRLCQLALTTAQRRGEVAGFRRSERGILEYRGDDAKPAKADAWLIPPERTKRLVAHTVPLSPLAIRLIDEAPQLEIDGEPCDHIFATGRRGDQPPTGWSRFKEQLDEEIGRAIAEEAKEDFDPARHRLPEWHVHDLRATAATHMAMARLSIDRRVISRILNHSEGFDRSMTNRYIRHTYDKEAAEALRLWASDLERITGENIVAMQGGRA